jgi:hypothetical protein
MVRSDRYRSKRGLSSDGPLCFASPGGTPTRALIYVGSVRSDARRTTVTLASRFRVPVAKSIAMTPISNDLNQPLSPDFPDDHLVYALRSFDKVLRSMT